MICVPSFRPACTSGVHDISDFIKASVHSLIEHLIFGSILASLVVWLFIRNWRAVLIAAVAIPALSFPLLL